MGKGKERGTSAGYAAKKTVVAASLLDEGGRR